jgi:hypothetical protein
MVDFPIRSVYQDDIRCRVQMVRVEIDARVGGQFVIVERRDGEDVEHRVSGQHT